MVQTNYFNNSMASGQPLKKKQKRENVETTDETDFISEPSNGLSSLTSLHLSLPPDKNEDDISSIDVNNQLNTNKFSCKIEDYTEKNSESSDQPVLNLSAPIYSYSYYSEGSNISNRNVSCLIDNSENSSQSRPFQEPIYLGLDEFQNALIKQCLCGIPEDLLRCPFEGYQILSSNNSSVEIFSEWPTAKILHFLSNLQLLFSVYLKQNSKGVICAQIANLCDNIMVKEYNLLEHIISLCEMRNRYINFALAKVVSNFLIIAKTNLNNEWLENMFNLLMSDNIDYSKISFSLEVIKQVVEWKDSDGHVLEETSNIAGSSSENQEYNLVNCSSLNYCDSESFDTSIIKGVLIKHLILRWPELINKIKYLIENNINVQAQTCILTFLELWENIISVKNNLSVIDTKPFYAHLEIFLAMLNNSLPPIIWKQILSLFNEVLCYGSTLALQDLLPDDPCKLAHFVIRYVKDHGFLDSVPFRRNDGFTQHSFVGTIHSTDQTQSNIDKTLLQKMVLLVLKSIALSIKETKSDSSDSSIGSDDSDYNQDMLVIGRSMKEVLRKLDIFLKNILDFHPETPFSKLLVHLFSDQDDYLIESMVCTLDIVVGIPERNAVYPEIIFMLNPTHSFVEFLKIVHHGSDVLLDYLVSNETCFLLYLLRFLKFVKKNWSSFVRSCGEGSISTLNEFDATMNVLINLSDQIERLVSRQLFPYNIDPVLRLLKVCQNLYHDNDFS